MTLPAQKQSDFLPNNLERFLDYRLSSAFQPIFSLAHRRIVGFEGLVRATCRSTNKPVSPFELFECASRSERVLTLDQQCQRLHIENFANAAPADRWLFLNIDAGTLNDRRYRDDHIARVLAAAGLPFQRLVIEVLESPSVDERALFDGIDYFRSRGALVALDDFGAGHSNFDRIWRLAPDIVKLDRSIITEAERHASGNLRRMLPNLVALMHEAGSLVLVEGIETQTQATIALDADADFVQGFYLAKPDALFADHLDTRRELGRITDRFAHSWNKQDLRERRLLAPYIKAFRSVRSKFKPSAAFEACCKELVAMPDVIRCALFNEKGEPIVLYMPDGYQKTPDERFKPLVDSQGGTWFRRRYIRDALNQPRRIQISRPYLSSTEGCLCVTISVSNTVEPRRIFCCEIAWHQ